MSLLRKFCFGSIVPVGAMGALAHDHFGYSKLTILLVFIVFGAGLIALLAVSKNADRTSTKS